MINRSKDIFEWCEENIKNQSPENIEIIYQLQFFSCLSQKKRFGKSNGTVNHVQHSSRIRTSSPLIMDSRHNGVTNGYSEVDRGFSSTQHNNLQISSPVRTSSPKKQSPVASRVAQFNHHNKSFSPTPTNMSPRFNGKFKKFLNVFF